MGVKQLFDDESSTYTYLLWDTTTKDAVIVDPVDIQVDRDIQAAKDLELNLVYGSTFHGRSVVVVVRRSSLFDSRRCLNHNMACCLT